MLLVIPVAALFVTCAEAPNSAPGHRTNHLALDGPPRIDRALGGTGWTINAPIPEPLGVAQGATVASGDGSRIYHIGGITGAMTATNKVRVYSTADNTWSDAADIPVTPGIRTFGAAVELNGFIYVFGGFDGTNILDSTWIYDEANDVWFQGANMPGPRFGSAVAADGMIIWLIGGVQDLSIGGESFTVWRYDPSTDTWFAYGETPIPMGRFRGSMLPNGDMHVLGGGFDGSTQCVFNFRVPSYSCRPPIPFGVTDGAIVTDGVRIFVMAGGGPAPRAAGQTQIFNTISRTWSLGPPMPAPGLDNTSGAIINGTLYVVGGYDGATPVSVNYSLLLSSAGAEDVSPSSMNPEPLEPLEPLSRRELKVNSRFDGPNPWSINWPVPEIGYGVAQGSTLASSDGSLIYHIGGLTGLGVSNRMRVYSRADDASDASSVRSPWWDAAPVPLSRGIRSYGSAVELNGFMYIFGGVSGNLPSEDILATTWIYDEAHDVWFRGTNMPGPRAGPAVATDGSVIWVIGGYNQSFGPDHSVWRYDPMTDRYATGFTNMPRNLGRIHGVWLSDGTVHVLGGGDGGSLNNHLVYNPSTDAWSFAPLIPLGVQDPATVTDGTLIYLAGAPSEVYPRGPSHTQIFDPASGLWFEGQPMPPWPGLGDSGIDNTSGTIANGIFYVMGGYTTGYAYFNYSVPLSQLSDPKR
jgi:N-acetylneuraminic acid mutarotase